MSAAAISARARFPWRTLGLIVVVVGALAQAWIVVEVSPSDLATGIGHMADLVRRAVPPSVSIWKNALWGSVVTIDVAILGTAAAMLVSLPLGVLAATNVTPSRPAYLVARGVIGVTRTIPDVVWALLFVTAVGLGPFAATLGLAVHSVGVLSRLYAEAIEDVDMGPVHALTVLGAGRAAIVSQAVLPTVLPPLIGLTLYRLDTNVRSSLVLGFVGGGGLGLQIESALNLFAYHDLATLLIAMGLLITGVEVVAVWLRRRIR